MNLDRPHPTDLFGWISRIQTDNYLKQVGFYIHPRRRATLSCLDIPYVMA